MVVVFVATSLTFALTHLSGGDPYSSYFDTSVSPEIVDRMRASEGYNLPVAQQYVRSLARTARGDFGYSVTRNADVAAVIRHTLPRTLWLMACALIASVGFGVALGTWQGALASTRADRAANIAVMLGYSIPEFWLAMLLLLTFGAKLRWFPVSSASSALDELNGPFAYALSCAYHMVLPWFALTLVGCAVFARFQRSAVRDTIGETFVRTARAKGLSEKKVVWRHTFRVSVLPLITVFGLWFPVLLGGAVFVEQVFNWPGMGMLLVQAVNTRDYALVTGCVIIGSAMTAIGSVLADFLREVADPRLRA